MTTDNPVQSVAAREQWELRVLYDAECPLCRREIEMLRLLDRGRHRIDFEDISASEFSAERYGLDQQMVVARIHAVLPGGSVIEGVEVFRRAYTAVGLNWLVVPTRWPVLRDACEVAYRYFARNRLRWTGREAACNNESCGVAPPATEAIARAGAGPR
jgi:predicted DCC family thiol-disulfide oxidoreductase YuxK